MNNGNGPLTRIPLPGEKLAAKTRNYDKSTEFVGDFRRFPATITRFSYGLLRTPCLLYETIFAFNITKCLFVRQPDANIF